MSRDAESDLKTSRLYDKRTVERNIKKGLLSRKDYDKYLKSLDDIAGKGVYGGLEPKDEEEDPTDAGPEADDAADDAEA